jgi:hypothetical protein
MKNSWFSRDFYLARGRMKIAVVIGMFAIIFALFSAYLAQFPDPSGTNGYYYLKQISQIGQGKGYYFHDYSIAFLFPAGLVFLGVTPLFSFALSVALVGTLIAAGACALNLSLTAATEKRWSTIAALFLVLAGQFLNMQFYELTMNYLKNSMALLFLIWSMVFLIQWKREQRRSFLIAAAIFALGAFFSHKTSVLFIGIVGLVYFIRFPTKKAILLGAAVVVVSAGIFLAFYTNSGELVASLLGFLQKSPNASMDWFQHKLHSDPSYCSMIFLNLASFIYYTFKRAEFDKISTVIIDSICLIALISLQPFQMPGANGPAYRIMLLISVFAVPVLAASLSGRKQDIALYAMVLTFIVSPMVQGQFHPNKFVPLLSRLKEDFRAISDQVTSDDHLIVQHGLEFFIDFHHNIRARQYASEDSSKRQFRILDFATMSFRERAAIPALQERAIAVLNFRFCLVKEEDWRQVVSTYSIKHSWQNPIAMRPKYLYD